MTNDCVAQSWYRFLRMIGSPISLCCPQMISHTPQFMQYILLRDDSIEPHQHPCLLILPQIFLKAMKGIASQVDAFLGKYRLKLLTFRNIQIDELIFKVFFNPWCGKKELSLTTTSAHLTINLTTRVALNSVIRAYQGAVVLNKIPL